MKAEEILELAKGRGARVKEIKKHCQFQTLFAKNVFGYCKQRGNRDYAFNMGSAGGPAIACTGAPPPSVGSHKGIREEEVLVIDYAPNPSPCPYRIENGEVMGWEILLPNIPGVK